MAKIGRNQPCPCGSGKKYKRCCSKPRSRGAAPMRTVSGLPLTPEPKRPPSIDVRPYVAAKMLDKTDRVAELPPELRRRAALLWTPKRVTSMSTEAITGKLQELGVQVSRERFVAAATDSPLADAWSLSDPWRATVEAAGPLHHLDDDYLGLAACELWRRWCPERPSQEMLDDWMQDGYKLTGTAACERWWPVWEAIRNRLEPTMRTCDAASPVFSGSQCIFNWVQDFGQELHNAALAEPRFAALGEQLCREVLAQFTDEDGLFGLNLRADLAEFLYLDDRPEQGEAVLLQLIEDHPDEPLGYARLSSILGYGPRGPRGGAAPDVRRAIALLEQALARPVRDALSWDLQARLDDLRGSQSTGDGQAEADTGPVGPASTATPEAGKPGG